MTESVIIVQNNKKTMMARYLPFAEGEPKKEYGIDMIDNIQFTEKNDWCYITLLDGETCADEFLLTIAEGDRLIYYYSDDSQPDCEFIVIENGKVIRKRYIYADTPELDRDEGVLPCEDREFKYWNDIDYFVGIINDNPAGIFE